MARARRLVLLATATSLLVAVALAALASASPERSHLTRIYRGDDGSALYTRLLGNTLYGFAEHPGTKLAFVLQGTVEGSAIHDVRWWDVPKGVGRRVATGTMELAWSQGGARLARTSGSDPGPDIWQAVSGGIAWPNKLTAGFQSTTTLSGAFTGDDASRYYLTEAGGSVVWVAEKDSQPGERPPWVSVFVGKRNGNYVSGTFADVRKGVAITASGNATLTVGADRTLRIADGTDRTKILTPDYALDFGRLAETVKARIADRVVGYGLAIAAHGIVVTRASGGLRLLSVDGGPKPFTNDTQNSADSTSKLVTAAAVMKALDERNISVDAKVGPYLPSCWKTVRNAAGLTFRDLLAHTSLLYKPPRIDCDKNPLLCLQKSIERGPQPERDGTKDGYDYENINYGMFRALLPLVTAPEKVKSEFTKANCNTANGRLNAIVSNRFAAHVLILLKDLDVVAGFGPSSGNRAYRYNFANQALPGIQTYATYLESGAGGLWISAPEYVQFLSALDRGAVVDQDVLAVMKSGRLGFERGCSLKDALGSCYAKNGSGTDARGRGSESQAVIFPGDVQVFLTINSRTNAYRGDRRDVLIAAFHAALR